MLRPEFSTQLDNGEDVIFGISVETRNSRLADKRGLDPEKDPQKTVTLTAVTNRRVIIELIVFGALIATTIPNADVRAVTINRKKYRDGPRIEILSVVDAAGKQHSLKIGGILGDREAEVRKAFPSAKVIEKKGLLAFLGL